ncbi:MAG: CPBP family intramembrane metalloprotease [Phycisphaerae bacterium]|nr:CPBP family intramembrane metalloprotease [Phycisphaerae bacterium]
MSRIQQFRVIYRKELTDILRDRRTLMAMILIPVVLYPVLMLGFVWAAQAERASLRTQQYTIAAGDAVTAEHLRELIHRAQEARPPSEEKRATFVVEVQDTPDEKLGDIIQARVDLDFPEGPHAQPAVLNIRIRYSEVNVRSRAAMEELSHLLGQLREVLARDSIQELLDKMVPSLPGSVNAQTILKPIEITASSTATDQQRGGWALGQIIPIILVLMTITGAVYPAIDLTAGERERGTLETLMATPTSPLTLIVGKFLVVATIGLATATLNLASVGATMHFGGLTHALTSEMPVRFPIGILPVVLLCMVPFALLFSAILVAVCSFARTFKEAQNYVMPVIIGALIPSAAVTLPSVRLEGPMLVLPVGNMVLLARELFQQTYAWSSVAVVMLSTTLYAAAAIALAARLFGQEAVLFVDVGSYKTLIRRRFMRPSPAPSMSQALVLVALLFPVSFYAQNVLFGSSVENLLHKLKVLAVMQFAGLFAVLPLAVCGYLKIDVVNTFRLRFPPAKAWLGVILLGSSSYLLAHRFVQAQSWLTPPSDALRQYEQQINAQLGAAPLWLMVLLLSLTPAITEELLFRGFLLRGLSAGLRKWSAIVVAAVIFGVFHFMVERMPLATLLGVVLGYVCWQTRSVLPGMLMHAMHNAWPLVVSSLDERVPRFLGMAEGHHPSWAVSLTVLLGALLAFVAGILIVRSAARTEAVDQHPAW